MVGSDESSFLGPTLFSGTMAVSFRECNSLPHWVKIEAHLGGDFLRTTPETLFVSRFQHCGGRDHVPKRELVNGDRRVIDNLLVNEVYQAFSNPCKLTINPKTPRGHPSVAFHTGC